MTERMRLAIVVLPLVLSATPLLAQNAPPPLRRTQIEFGLTDTRGNSRITAISLGEKHEYRPGQWLFTQTLNWVNANTDGTQTANNIRAGLRADYSLTARAKLFALVGYERNPFAGLGRRFEESVGLAWAALVGPRDLLDLELGAGVNQQRAGVSENFAVARAATRYRRNLSTAAYFEQKVELIENLNATDDVRVNSESVVVAPLSRLISLRLSYLVAFDNVPVAGKKQTDTVFASGIQVVF